MMRLRNVEAVKPMTHYAVVSIIPVDNNENGLYEGDGDTSTIQKVKLYNADVISIGPEVHNSEYCPGLKEKDTVIISEFAGYHIATSDDKLYKLINGYDIMATTKNHLEPNEENVDPTADRLLVSTINISVDENGLYLPDKEAQDPRLLALSFAKVLKYGPTCKLGLEPGTVVAFEPYAGEVVRDAGFDSTPELKVIREADILLTA